MPPPSTAGESDPLDRNADERGRGSTTCAAAPWASATLEEMIDDDHAIVSSATGP